MSATATNYALDQLYRNDMAQENDPGDAGTLGVENKGIAIFEIVTAGAETRVLEAATSFGVGTEVIVILKTDGGDLTITGADASVVLADAGDMVAFRVSRSGVTKVWRIVGLSTGAVASNVVTRAVAAAGAGKVPVSAGANKALQAATPVAITGAITDGDSLVTPFQALLTALAAFGLITDSTT